MLQFGFATEDITPPVGARMPGGFSMTTGKGVRDRLLAVACVAFDGRTAAALVGIDTLFITKPTVTAARRLIQSQTKIPGENVLIGANHTHTGGPMASCLGNEEDESYTDDVARKIARAVTTAWQNLHAAEVAVGTGREDSIAFNRRFLMKDGREITHPGKPGTPHHAEIVRPSGPTDPDVGVLAVRRPKGAVCGVFVNFSCHSTVVGGDQFSPDYTGYLRQHLRAVYGDIPIGFLLGPCGDVTQVDNRSTAREFGVEHADLMGRKLAAEAFRTVGRAAWLDSAAVAVHTQTVPVRIRPEPDIVAERPAFGLGMGEVPDKVYVQERALVAAERAKTPVILAETQAIRLGPLGIVANGAEYFVEHALRIKECSPFKPTWVVSLANENLGYVPTAQAFVGGGYEPRTARSSKLAIDAGQRLLEGAVVALNKIKPER